MEQTLSVFGLGKLGCTMLACFAHKGWDVIGVDTNYSFAEQINRGACPIYEPGVAVMLKDNVERIKASTDGHFAVLNSGVSFVIVPTPSTKDGSFTISYVLNVAKTIAQALKKKDTYHLIVITSTVLPGSMADIKSQIEHISGKVCGVDFGLCYNPDFIALGNVVHDFLNPDMVLIGESDPKAGKILEDIHHKLTDNEPKTHRMAIHNAELSKITLNSFCTLKITFANIIAEICEGMPEGNAEDVLNAVGDDSRVGRKYFKGGLSFGGPCFCRDNRAFALAAKKYGVKETFAEQTDKINDYIKTWRIPQRLLKLLKDRKSNKLSVLGLTYKDETTLVEESAPISVVKYLSRRGIEVHVYDPAGIEEAQKVLAGSPDLTYHHGGPEACIFETAVCFVATPWKEFKELSADVFRDKMLDNPAILDAWSLYDFSDEEGIDYWRLGQTVI